MKPPRVMGPHDWPAASHSARGTCARVSLERAARSRRPVHFAPLCVGAGRARSSPMTKSETDGGPLQMLLTARDEARLKLHLLGMEGRKRWDELEDKIFSIEERLGQKAEKTADAVAESALELADSVKQFVDAHLRKAQARGSA